MTDTSPSSSPVSETPEPDGRLTPISDTLAGLARLAAWMVVHPEANVNLGALAEHNLRLLWCTFDDKAFPGFTRALMDGAPIGAITKDADDDYQRVTRDFGGGVTVKLYIPRAKVCERVVVGTRDIEVPDPDAPKVTVTEEIVEWRCAPILARSAGGA